MIGFLEFIAIFVSVLIDAVMLLMLVRMIVSLFAPDGGGRLGAFLVCTTEPFIVPVRFVLAKFNLLQDSPIDWSFTIAYFVLMMVDTMLPVI